jgi:peptidoglycan-N-acetylglucosamine deacetylase
MNKAFFTTSWDDGTPSDLKMTKLMRSYGIAGTFYISKNHSYIERPLNSEEILKISEMGFEVGAHTMSHPDLTRLEKSGAFKEISESKLYLEKILNKKVPLFAYPFGYHNKEVERLVEQAGFIAARTIDIIPINSNSLDPFRVGVTCQIGNGSPLNSLRTIFFNDIKISSIIDWSNRVDQILRKARSGEVCIIHLWGHSSEITLNNQWDALEKIFSEISSYDWLEKCDNYTIMSNSI